MFFPAPSPWFPSEALGGDQNIQKAPGPSGSSPGVCYSLGTPWDSVGLRGTPWDSVGLRGTPWDSVGLRGTPWDSVGLRGTIV